MTFKAGDLVILVRARNPVCQEFVGQIKVLGRKDSLFANSWLFDPPFFASTGREVSWSETGMRPIRPQSDDATDEMLLLVGNPEGVPA